MIATMTLPQPLQLKPVTRIELRKSIRSMKATKSTGTDGISMKIIKDFLPLLEPALENIVNQSILHNTFPDILKESKIIPIQKPETKPNIPASYTPINILPGLQKNHRKNSIWANNQICGPDRTCQPPSPWKHSRPLASHSPPVSLSAAGGACRDGGLVSSTPTGSVCSI